MTECEMNAGEIKDGIEGRLDAAAHEYWAAMPSTGRKDLVIDVQKGDRTIAECAELVRTWASGAGQDEE